MTEDTPDGRTFDNRAGHTVRLERENALLRSRNEQLEDALHDAWGLIANSSDWIPKEPDTPCECSRANWEKAAERWRDEQFHHLLSAEPEKGIRENFTITNRYL